MAIRIVDVTDDATLRLLPPCADPGFDHRSCDYWEDADRGSKAARLSWLDRPLHRRLAGPRRSTRSPRGRRRRPRNPFAPARGRRSTRSCVRDDDAPDNPFAPSRAGPGRPRRTAQAPPARPRPCRVRQLCEGRSSPTTSPSPTRSSGRSPRTRGRYGRASCTRSSGSPAAGGHHLHRDHPGGPRPGPRPALVEAVCDDLAGRGFAAVETYPERRPVGERHERRHAGVLGAAGFVDRRRRRPLPGHAPRARVGAGSRSRRPLAALTAFAGCGGPSPSAPAQAHHGHRVGRGAFPECGRFRVGPLPEPVVCHGSPPPAPRFPPAPRPPRPSPGTTRCLRSCHPISMASPSPSRRSRSPRLPPTRRSRRTSRGQRSRSSWRRTTSRRAWSRSSSQACGATRSSPTGARRTAMARAPSPAVSSATRRRSWTAAPSTSRPATAASACTTRYLGERGVLVSLFSLGEGRFGERLIADLRP